MVERNSVKRLQVRVDEVMTRIVFDEVALTDGACVQKGEREKERKGTRVGNLPDNAGFLRFS
jgi:hypothetical protein